MENLIDNFDNSSSSAASHSSLNDGRSTTLLGSMRDVERGLSQS